MSRRVLVVDDEIHIVHVVAIKLRNNGFEVLTAENGAEAYKIAQTEKPDVVVTDFQMPAMTGLELVEAMRKNPETAGIPVIMLTARGFAIDDMQKAQLRISECLSKPFSPKELLRTVEDVLHEPAVTQ
jgi:two-component system alkaline phosphatase synthesis response regulator PhoP